jgi:excisionase family DNA binding protein
VPTGSSVESANSAPGKSLLCPLEFPGLDFPDRQTLYPFEAAQRLGCHVDHVYDLITEGVIKAIDIRGRNNRLERRRVRIPLEAWRDFIRGRTI